VPWGNIFFYNKDKNVTDLITLFKKHIFKEKPTDKLLSEYPNNFFRIKHTKQAIMAKKNQRETGEKKEKNTVRVVRSHNNAVYATPPFGGSGFRSPRSVGLRPRSHGSLHPHLGWAGLLRSPYSPSPNVVYCGTLCVIAPKISCKFF
jgi:hypothetical protein